ncbi:hypothetical protein VTN02DRAFT_2257 [Thermoascus thermophilus]
MFRPICVCGEHTVSRDVADDRSSSVPAARIRPEAAPHSSSLSLSDFLCPTSSLSAARRCIRSPSSVVCRLGPRRGSLAIAPPTTHSAGGGFGGTPPSPFRSANPVSGPVRSIRNSIRPALFLAACRASTVAWPCGSTAMGCVPCSLVRVGGRRQDGERTYASSPRGPSDRPFSGTKFLDPRGHLLFCFFFLFPSTPATA